MAAAGAMSVSAMFVALQGALTADQDIREVGAGPGRGLGAAGSALSRPTALCVRRRSGRSCRRWSRRPGRC